MARTKKPNAAFFQAIGRSLVMWQDVEDALLRVFLAASTCQSIEVARTIFFSPKDFSEKLNMTHNALRTPLRAKGELEAWIGKPKNPGLRARMRSESEFRNALAHFTVGAEASDGMRKHILMPTLSDPNEEYRRSGRKQKQINTLDIDAIRDAGVRFDALAKDIGKFAIELAREPKTPPPQGLLSILKTR